MKACYFYEDDKKCWFSNIFKQFITELVVSFEQMIIVVNKELMKNNGMHKNNKM